MTLNSARAVGFSGELCVDFPHKGLAKKYFLCLSKASGIRSEGQIRSQACPLALPSQIVVAVFCGPWHTCTVRKTYMQYGNYAPAVCSILLEYVVQFDAPHRCTAAGQVSQFVHIISIHGCVWSKSSLRAGRISHCIAHCSQDC